MCVRLSLWQPTESRRWSFSSTRKTLRALPPVVRRGVAMADPLGAFGPSPSPPDLIEWEDGEELDGVLPGGAGTGARHHWPPHLSTSAPENDTKVTAPPQVLVTSGSDLNQMVSVTGLSTPSLSPAGPIPSRSTDSRHSVAPAPPLLESPAAKKSIAGNITEVFKGMSLGGSRGRAAGRVGSGLESANEREVAATRREHNELHGAVLCVSSDAAEELRAQAALVATLSRALEAGKQSCDALASFLKGLATAEAAYAKACSKLPSPMSPGDILKRGGGGADGGRDGGGGGGGGIQQVLTAAAEFPRSAAVSHGDLATLLTEEASRVLQVGSDCAAAGRAMESEWARRRKGCAAAAASFAVAGDRHAKLARVATSGCGSGSDGGSGAGGGSGRGQAQTHQTEMRRVMSVTEDPWVAESAVSRRYEALRGVQRSARAAAAAAVQTAKTLDTRRLDTLNSVTSGYLLLHESLLQRELAELASTASRMQGRGLHSSTFELNLSRFGHTSPCPPV